MTPEEIWATKPTTLAKSAGLAIATVVVLETQDKASARTLEKIGAVLGSPLEAP